MVSQLRLPIRSYRTMQSNDQQVELLQCHLLSTQAPEGEGAPQPTDPTKFSGKKSKATAKKGAGNTQWDILKLSGIPEAEIPSFRYKAAPLPAETKSHASIRNQELCISKEGIPSFRCWTVPPLA